MENKKEKIAAVVVTYNRKQLLKECLDALLSQTRALDSIILIDNASTDGTPEFLKENGYLDNPTIDYVRLPENTGGAGGFYEGVKRGYEKGYDWLWLMDDDSEPKKNALEILSFYFNLKNVSALSCLQLDKEMRIDYPHRGYFNFKNVFSGIVKSFDEAEINKDFVEIDHSSFVGLLIKRSSISKIGYPKKEFFIHYDDVEYCIRLRKEGKILLIPKSVIIHKEANRGEGKSFLGKVSYRKSFEKFWLTYYGIRNLTWLGKQYSENKLLFYFQMIKSMVRPIVGIILFDDYKLKRIKLILNAYIAGLKGDFDNNKPKKILYGN
jgi:GT2 family glycosyltransferase